MDLKKILNETADRLESGQLAWTKDAYILIDGEDTPDDFDPRDADLSQCSVCAVGACVLVGMLNGEIEADNFDHGLHDFGIALGRATGYTRKAGEIISFNDRIALSAKSAANKLRSVAEELPA